MTNKRVNYEIIVGGQINEAMIANAANLFSKEFGGVTVIKSSGYWAENGDSFTNDYDNVRCEKGVIFKLCVMSEVKSETFANCLEPFYQSDAEWIHIEKSFTFAEHFKMSDFCSVAA